jgi:hypothetical protein
VFQARDHRGLVAIKGPGTAAPHPQGHSAAKDGKAAILLFREEPRERRGRRLPTAIVGREAGSQTASPGQIRQNKAHGSRAVTASGDHHPEPIASHADQPATRSIFAGPGSRRESSRSAAIKASGALNRPRRRAGGNTASTASSFSDGSIRR